MLGTIAAPEANCRPQHLRLDLTLRGDVLHGVLMTVPSQEGWRALLRFAGLEAL